MSLYVGCPIWSFKGWVGGFYPKGTKRAQFLREYARRLTAIEGNTTFYAAPAERTIRQWAAETPPDFRFCPKIPQAVSHRGRLVDHVQEALAFVDAMSGLRTRLGPMFLQLPPRYGPGLIDDLEKFLAGWPHGARLGVEVRHPAWFEPAHHQALNLLLARHEMARVVIDTRPIRSLDGDKLLEGSVYQTLLEARERKPDVPVLPEPTTDFVFIRYIGHPRLELNAGFLDEWSEFLVSQLRRQTRAYVICHSPDNLTAPYLCRELHRRVAAGLAIAPLPWDDAERSSFEQEPLL